MAEPNEEKKVWTEEERLELAAKLDAELDDFINGLEKKRYEEGWPEDRWQEEMDKHPFFMKKAPQPGDEVHPMFEGLQKLKYDPEENTREELALNYKEDGNFYMKHKKFRTAIYSYTEGIKIKCENPEVMAALYNNRSLAHFHLKNYRSATIDADTSLKFKPDYDKVAIRAAKCDYILEKFNSCIERCENLLEKFPENEDINMMYKSSKTKLSEIARDERRKVMARKKHVATFQRLCDALKERSVQFYGLEPDQPLTEEFLRPKFLALENDAVHVSQEDTSVIEWPAIFCYPQHMFNDYQLSVSENAKMIDCLVALELDQLPCDTEHLYSKDTVSVYYEDRKAGTVHRVHNKKTLKSIVAEERFYVYDGTLIFYIVPTNSQIEDEFVSNTSRPTVFDQTR